MDLVWSLMDCTKMKKESPTQESVLKVNSPEVSRGQSDIWARHVISQCIRAVNHRFSANPLPYLGEQKCGFGAGGDTRSWRSQDYLALGLLWRVHDCMCYKSGVYV